MPEKPSSPKQRFRITAVGRACVEAPEAHPIDEPCLSPPSAGDSR